MKILLTAFEPFDNLDTNSSLEVLKNINLDYVVKEVLPVSYERVKVKLKEATDRHHPDFIINLGQAGGEKMLRIEKFALNYTRASIADNDNDLRKKGLVFEDGPLALTSNLSIEDILDKAKEDNVESYISLSAGGYICNSCYYTSLYLNDGNALFIHLPYFEGQLEGKTSVNIDILIKNTIYYIEKIAKKISESIIIRQNLK